MSLYDSVVITGGRGMLAGDVLWLATIAFIFAILTGVVR